MYAVIETGGKQYRVEVGTELEVELLDAEPGKTVTLERVLLVADGDDASIGTPVVDGAAVSAEVVRQDRTFQGRHEDRDEGRGSEEDDDQGQGCRRRRRRARTQEERAEARHEE